MITNHYKNPYSPTGKMESIRVGFSLLKNLDLLGQILETIPPRLRSAQVVENIDKIRSKQGAVLAIST